MASYNEANPSFERSDQLENGNREEIEDPSDGGSMSFGVTRRYDAIHQRRDIIRQRHHLGRRQQDASIQKLGNVNRLSDTEIFNAMHQRFISSRRQRRHLIRQQQNAYMQQLRNVNQLSDTDILIRREGHSTEITSQGNSESALNLENYVDEAGYREILDFFA